MAKNLFTAAKSTAATKKADKHESVEISKNFEKDLARMSAIDSELATLEAERATLDAGVREAAKDAMIKLYQQKNAFPGTLKVVAGKQSFMFITCDKYIKIDEARATELSEIYNPEVVSEKTVYTLNPALLEKYGQVISDLIMNSKKIADKDKEELIQANTAWSVAKGMVEKLRNATFAKFNLNQLFEDLKPIFQIKSIKE